MQRHTHHPGPRQGEDPRGGGSFAMAGGAHRLWLSPSLRWATENTHGAWAISALPVGCAGSQAQGARSLCGLWAGEKGSRWQRPCRRLREEAGGRLSAQDSPLPSRASGVHTRAVLAYTLEPSQRSHPGPPSVHTRQLASELGRRVCPARLSLSSRRFSGQWVCCPPGAHNCFPQLLHGFKGALCISSEPRMACPGRPRTLQPLCSVWPPELRCFVGCHGVSKQSGWGCLAWEEGAAQSRPGAQKAPPPGGLPGALWTVGLSFGP